MAHRTSQKTPGQQLSPKNAIFSFVAPENGIHSSHTLQKRSLVEALHGHNWPEKSFFLETMEKGVMYPIVHFTEVTDNDKLPLRLGNASSSMGVKLQQGSYCEIKAFSPGIVPRPEIVDSRSHKAWIFMGFKTLENTFNEVLEDNWKDWTGARLTYMNLSDEFGLSRLSFYRRTSPKDFEVFMYIMVVECETVNAMNKVKLLDFVQRLRVERMIGYLSVYKVVPKYPSSISSNGLKGNIRGSESSSEDTYSTI